MKLFDEANKKSKHPIRNPNWGKGKIMKNKSLDRGSRRLRFVSKLRQTLLLRNRSAPAICVVMEVRREGREEAEEWCELAIYVAVVEVRHEGSFL